MANIIAKFQTMLTGELFIIANKVVGDMGERVLGFSSTALL